MYGEIFLDLTLRTSRPRVADLLEDGCADAGLAEAALCRTFELAA